MTQRARVEEIDPACPHPQLAAVTECVDAAQGIVRDVWECAVCQQRFSLRPLSRWRRVEGMNS